MAFLKKLWGAITAPRLVALTALASFTSFAQDAITIPDTGVDVKSYASAAITSLGAVVAVVVGGTIAFLLIRAGIRWIRSMK